MMVSLGLAKYLFLYILERVRLGDIEADQDEVHICIGEAAKSLVVIHTTMVPDV